MSLRQLTDKKAHTGKNKMRWWMYGTRDGEPREEEEREEREGHMM